MGHYTRAWAVTAFTYSLACVLGVAACRSERAAPQRLASAAPIAPRYSVSTAAPAFLVGLSTGDRDQQGEPVTIRCATCHSLLAKPPELPTDASRTKGPHVGLRFAHGELRCASCHDSRVVHSLRLADGRELAPADAIELCSQCHGPQARD